MLKPRDLQTEDTTIKIPKVKTAGFYKYLVCSKDHRSLKCLTFVDSGRRLLSNMMHVIALGIKNKGSIKVIGILSG